MRSLEVSTFYRCSHRLRSTRRNQSAVRALPSRGSASLRVSQACSNRKTTDHAFEESIDLDWIREPASPACGGPRQPIQRCSYLDRHHRCHVSTPFSSGVKFVYESPLKVHALRVLWYRGAIHQTSNPTPISSSASGRSTHEHNPLRAWRIRRRHRRSCRRSECYMLRRGIPTPVLAVVA